MAAAAVLPLLLASSLLVGPRRGYLVVYAVYQPRPGAARILYGVSFSVWAFYPTKNGTVFQAIYNGTGEAAYVSMSSLRRWAEAWIEYYGPGAAYYVAPSVVVFVSYVANVDGRPEVLVQQAMIPLNLSYPLEGRGYAARVVVSSPLALGPAPPRAAGVFLAPSRVWWYPSRSGLAPISLYTVVGSQALLHNASLGAFATFLQMAGMYLFTSVDELGAASVSGASFERAVELAEAGEYAQALRALSPVVVPGPSLTVAHVAGGYIAATSALGQEFSSDVPILAPVNVGQDFIVGQAALVNWTAYYVPRGGGTPRPAGWELDLMVTAAKAINFNGGIFVPMYGWHSTAPCVNLTLWAREYEEIESGGAPPQEANATCPIPNTPAPVDWQDYEVDLTLVANVTPENTAVVCLAELVAGPSPRPAVGAVLDVGSALASVAAGSVAAAMGQEGHGAAVAFAIAGALDPVILSSYSSALADFFSISNAGPARALAYVPSGPPAYIIGGAEYTIPRGFFFVNFTG